MLMHFPQLIKLLMDCTVVKLQCATLLEWFVLASLTVFGWIWDSSAASGEGLGAGSSFVILEKNLSSGSMKLMLMSIISGCS